MASDVEAAGPLARAAVLANPMTWLILAYFAIGYWHFRQVLRCTTAWDGAGTILLNAMLALIVGPILVVPAAAYGWLTRD